MTTSTTPDRFTLGYRSAEQFYGRGARYALDEILAELARFRTAFPKLPAQVEPYIDRIELNVASSEIIMAKTATGESDLQLDGLTFGDYTMLKQAEKSRPLRVSLWKKTQGSAVALMPNLNCKDDVWRGLFRDHPGLRRDGDGHDGREPGRSSGPGDGCTSAASASRRAICSRIRYFCTLPEIVIG